MFGRKRRHISGKGSSMCKSLKEMKSFCKKPEKNISLSTESEEGG